MTDPATYRPAPGMIPTDPGVYRFIDPEDRVIYVGKAINLRSRLANYFQDLANLHPRTRTMVTTACRVEWTVVASEVEALQLEYTWIKKYDPRFNVKYRDDKSYPYLAVSLNEVIPRAYTYRGPLKKGVKYFGPYSHVWAIRETLDLLTRVFPIRTCTAGVYKRHQLLGRSCLNGYIGKCTAPCVGKISSAEHKDLVDQFVRFMNGHTNDVVKELTAQMEKAAAELDFEAAARFRDDLAAIAKVMEQQVVVLGDGTDADVFGFSFDDLVMSVQVFHVRAGRIKGQRGQFVELPAGFVAADQQEQGEVPEQIAGALADFLVHFYTDLVDADGPSCLPREILVQAEPAQQAEVEKLLSGLRQGPVSLRIPQRGDKKALLETVTKNAEEAFRQYKLKRVGDLTARSEALHDLQEVLGMEQAPLRIECTDISHISGTDVVASLVVFEDGLPKKADYRRYKIKEAAGDGHSNDVASIAEVVRRRFLRHKEDQRMPDESQFVTGEYESVPNTLSEVASQKFAYPPQLFIVDGGLPQVRAAQAVFDELGINDVVLCGLAKRLEEVWVPDDDQPLIMPRSSQALFLLQQLRDEAHRFAITFHRQQRSNRMTRSGLDAVPGLGEAKRQALLKHFGSLKAIKAASSEQLQEAPGIGPKLAQVIVDFFANQAPTS